MGRKVGTKIKRPRKSAAEIEAEEVAAKALAIGLPEHQVARGGFKLVDVSLHAGEKPKTTVTLVNRGGTPVARWKAAGLLSSSQIAAIDHCEKLWAQLPGKSLVAKLDGMPRCEGRTSPGIGWSQHEALDDLRRIKGYFPARWWSVFENVCRFDEGAGFAGSAITDVRSDQVTAARVTVQFVADIVAMKERLA